MEFHGNDNLNPKPHHLYAIMDKETGREDKFGISHDPFGKDGLSARVRKQVDSFNRIAGWLRFFGVILLRNLPGKRAAKKIESEHIAAFREKYGHNPPGNLRN